MVDKQYLLLPEYSYLKDSYNQQNKNLGVAVVESWKQQADRLDRGVSQVVVDTANSIAKAIWNILANSIVIPNESIQLKNHDEVEIWCEVTVKFNETNETKTFNICWTHPLSWNDSSVINVSYLSPLASSMRWKSEWDDFSYNSSWRIFSWRIINIKTMDLDNYGNSKY